MPSAKVNAVREDMRRMRELQQQLRDARAAIRSVVETGSKGFVVSESCGAEGRYQVIAAFRDIESMQAFYRSLANLKRFDS